METGGKVCPWSWTRVSCQKTNVKLIIHRGSELITSWVHVSFSIGLVQLNFAGADTQSIFNMDKYEDLGLEASKFIEDLNMYEASRDGLFRMRRDAGNNPDFEETRRVFASKMTKIHMQKHQEEMAKNNQAIRMNGGHNSTYYTKDRPPINSYRQPGEAAAKPPILSGPVPGAAAGGQYAQLDGQRQHSEPPAGRAYGFGNSYEDKERLDPHPYQHSTANITPPSPGSASPSAPSHARHPVSPSAAWAASRDSQLSPSSPGSGSNIAFQQQPQRLPAPPAVNSLPSQQNQVGTPAINRSPPSSAGPSRGWTGEPSGSAKPDLIPALPLSAFTGGADFHVQQPSAQPAAYYAPASPTSRPLTNHNGPVPASPIVPAPCETPQLKAQGTPSVLVHPSVSKSSSQGQGQCQMPTCGLAASAEPCQTPCSSKPVQLTCQPLPTQPPEQGPSTAEIKLEALTKRLEKEMDAQPKADYFGKIFQTTNKGASVCVLDHYCKAH